MKSGSVRLSMDRLKQIQGNLSQKTERNVAQITHAMRDVAAERAAVDTGYMKSKIYAVVEVEGTKAIGTVGCEADYAVYQEFGTWKMAAHPFMIPALESGRRDLMMLNTWLELFA